MNGRAVILRELHRLRRHAKELQEQIDCGPRAAQAQQAKAARQEELLREAQDRLKKLKVQIHEKEVSLKTTHQQVAKHERQLNEAAGKKEYDALRHEVAADRQKCQQLEDEVLEAMTQVEEQTARLPELEQAARQAQADFARFEQEAGQRQAGFHEQLDRALAQLKEAEAGLPDDVRPQYDRLVAARGEDALAAATGRTCVACYTEITAQMYNDLLSGRLVLCKACGRLLYLPE